MCYRPGAGKKWKKPTDPNDFPLTKNAAYFANEDDYHKYVELMGDVPPEVMSPFVHVHDSELLTG